MSVSDIQSLFPKEENTEEKETDGKDKKKEEIDKKGEKEKKDDEKDQKKEEKKLLSPAAELRLKNYLQSLTKVRHQFFFQLFLFDSS